MPHACWGARPENSYEALEEWSIDEVGLRTPRYVVTCDGDDVTGPLTAEYIQRILGLDVSEIVR